MPQQYNEEYEKAQNLNPLLSTYHIGAIMTVLKKVPECHFALVDQFTRSPYIKMSWKERFLVFLFILIRREKRIWPWRQPQF